MKKAIWFIMCIFITMLLFVSCEKEEHIHSFGDWTITVKATCTEPGEQERLCSCGEKQVQAIPATGHSFSDWTIVKNPTCTEPGEQEQICACGERIKQDIPATGHTEGQSVVDTQPTCTEEGTKHIECSICGAVIKSESIPATGHTDGDWIIDKEATCAEEGSKHRVCKVCGATIKTGTISKTGNHDYKKTKTLKEATCTEKGKEEYKCSICGATNTKEIPALGHDTDSNGVCKRCGTKFMNMTSKEKTEAGKVSKMTHSVRYYSDSIKIQIEFKDEDGYTAYSPAYVDVRILNSNGTTVLKKTYTLKSTSSGIEIDKSDIKNGESADGVLYYKVYNTGYFEFDEIGRDIEDLPWTANVTIDLPNLPATYSYTIGTYGYRYKVTDIRFVIEDDDLHVYASGEKTYSNQGNESRHYVWIGCILYDSKGNIIDKTYIAKFESIKVGEKFNDAHALFRDVLKPGEKYKVVLVDYDNNF